MNVSIDVAEGTCVWLDKCQYCIEIRFLSENWSWLIFKLDPNLISSTVILAFTILGNKNFSVLLLSLISYILAGRV